MLINVASFEPRKGNETRSSMNYIIACNQMQQPEYEFKHVPLITVKNKKKMYEIW